jgi:ribonuclease P protein component
VGQPKVRPGHPPTATSFSSSDRLRTAREFQRVAREGRRASSRSFLVLAASRPVQSGLARIGLTVSRQVGGAVVRNRLKRRLREWFRTSALRRWGPIDVVVIARPPARELASEPLRAELDGLARQAAAGAQA